MNKQIVVSPKGERLVVIPEDEYNALVEAAEDAEDVAAGRMILGRIAAGEGEFVPSDVVMRMVEGENPIRVYRELRGMSAKELAEKAGIAQAYLSQLETGKREGPVATLRRLAEALSVTIDDLVP